MSITVMKVSSDQLLVWVHTELCMNAPVTVESVYNRWYTGLLNSVFVIYCYTNTLRLKVIIIFQKAQPCISTYLTSRSSYNPKEHAMTFVI